MKEIYTKNPNFKGLIKYKAFEDQNYEKPYLKYSPYIIPEKKRELYGEGADYLKKAKSTYVVSRPAFDSYVSWPAYNNSYVSWPAFNSKDFYQDSMERYYNSFPFKKGIGSKSYKDLFNKDNVKTFKDSYYYSKNKFKNKAGKDNYNNFADVANHVENENPIIYKDDSFKLPKNIYQAKDGSFYYHPNSNPFKKETVDWSFFTQEYDGSTQYHKNKYFVKVPPGVRTKNVPNSFQDQKMEEKPTVKKYYGDNYNPKKPFSKKNYLGILKSDELPKLCHQQFYKKGPQIFEEKNSFLKY